jgi:hypothetical protein
LNNLTKIQDRAKSLTGVSVSPSGVPKGYAKQSVQTAIQVLEALDLYGKKTDAPFCYFTVVKLTFFSFANF